MGFAFGLLCAALFAAKEGINKKLTQKTNIYVILWITTLLMLPFFAVALLFEKQVAIQSGFWYIIPVNISLFTLSSLLLIKAMQISPLSLTLPFLSFSPVFMIFTSWIILGQLPNSWGIIGIVLIVIGSYILNLKKVKKNFLAPFTAIGKEKGSLLALAVAFIWSITSNLDKIAIDNSSTFSYLLLINIGVVIVLSVILISKQRTTFLSAAQNNIKLASLVAAIGSAAVAFQMLAIQHILVPYVIAMKRTGTTLGGIIIGQRAFHETEDKAYRLVGGIIMAIGIIIILVLH